MLEKAGRVRVSSYCFNEISKRPMEGAATFLVSTNKVSGRVRIEKPVWPNVGEILQTIRHGTDARESCSEQ